jgi:hypothetical protein
MAEVTMNREAIGKWAESRGGKPAAVERTHKGGDVGIIRIMSPGATERRRRRRAALRR